MISVIYSGCVLLTISTCAWVKHFKSINFLWNSVFPLVVFQPFFSFHLAKMRVVPFPPPTHQFVYVYMHSIPLRTVIMQVKTGMYITNKKLLSTLPMNRISWPLSGHFSLICGRWRGQQQLQFMKKSHMGNSFWRGFWGSWVISDFWVPLFREWEGKNQRICWASSQIFILIINF